jgi:hypothetical protein
VPQRGAVGVEERGTQVTDRDRLAEGLQQLGELESAAAQDALAERSPREELRLR